MYSRQGIHPQRVTGTPHGTPDPPARPFAPYRRARAPMSDRASRSRVAPCGHDTRRAAHCARGAARALLTHLRWLSHTTHNAHSNLLLMHMHTAVLACSPTHARSRSRGARRALRLARQPLALQEVVKLIVSSTCAKGGVKEGPGQRQHVLHCRPHGGRGSGAGEDGRWGRQARSLRRGRHTFTRTFTCPPRSRGGRASKPRCQRPRRRRAVDPDLGRQQAGNQAPVSAGCLCKCHGSMGASQAAAGGPRSSGMMP